MKRQLIRSNIVAVQADALIYSTNIQLALTGGVGAALRERFGLTIQNELHNCFGGTGRLMAEVGDVFETHPKGALWKVIFHTIATNELYYTQPDTVFNILRKCFIRCIEMQCIKSIIASPLGAGYGDLDLGSFVSIANRLCAEYDTSQIQNFAIVCWDKEEFERLSDVASKVDKGWEQA